MKKLYLIITFLILTNQYAVSGILGSGSAAEHEAKAHEARFRPCGMIVGRRPGEELHSKGSATIIGDGRFALTARHVIEGAVGEKGVFSSRFTISFSRDGKGTGVCVECQRAVYFKGQDLALILLKRKMAGITPARVASQEQFDAIPALMPFSPTMSMDERLFREELLRLTRESRRKPRTEGAAACSKKVKPCKESGADAGIRVAATEEEVRRKPEPRAAASGGGRARGRSEMEAEAAAASKARRIGSKAMACFCGFGTLCTMRDALSHISGKKTLTELGRTSNALAGHFFHIARDPRTGELISFHNPFEKKALAASHGDSGAGIFMNIGGEFVLVATIGKLDVSKDSELILVKNSHESPRSGKPGRLERAMALLDSWERG